MVNGIDTAIPCNNYPTDLYMHATLINQPLVYINLMLFICRALTHLLVGVKGLVSTQTLAFQLCHIRNWVSQFVVKLL